MLVPYACKITKQTCSPSQEHWYASPDTLIVTPVVAEQEYWRERHTERKHTCTNTTINEVDCMCGCNIRTHEQCSTWFVCSVYKDA